MDEADRHLNEVWWLLLLRGIFLILFGIFAVLWPGLTLATLAAFFAAFLLLSGIVDIISGIRAEGRRSMWFLGVIIGVLETGLGVYIIKNNLAITTFIGVVGLSLIALGILEIISSFDSGARHRVLLIMAGALAVIAGFITLRYPISSGLSFTWVLGLWGILSGSMQVALSLSYKHELRRVERSARSV